MSGNGADQPRIEQAVRIDPNVLRALNMLQDLVTSGRCIGFGVVGLSPDGNAFNLSTMPSDPRMLSFAIGECFSMMTSLEAEKRRLSQQMAPSAIIRPPNMPMVR
jgi:hypothetical protein